MATKGHLSHISLESEPLDRVITAGSKYVFVLRNNESIDSGLVIVKVATVVLQFLFVIPNRERSIVFVQNDDVVSIKLSYLSNIFIKAFESVNDFRGLSVPHVESAVERS